MSVFKDDTWSYLEVYLKQQLDNSLTKMTQTDTSYKEIMRLQGQVQAYKTLLNLPQSHETVARTNRIT